MKKQNLKSLQLKKKSISSLQLDTNKGGLPPLTDTGGVCAYNESRKPVRWLTEGDNFICNTWNC